MRSGRFAPPELVVLTNSIDSPLAERGRTRDRRRRGAGDRNPGQQERLGHRRAAAVERLAARRLRSRGRPEVLEGTADAVEALAAKATAGRRSSSGPRIAEMRSALVLGHGLRSADRRRDRAQIQGGQPICTPRDSPAGEFRHGSRAVLDAECAVIGIVDADGLPIVARPLDEALASGALRYTIGSGRYPGDTHLGPDVDVPFNTLAWLVTAQMLALHAARARGIDSDRPRGLTKAVVTRLSARQGRTARRIRCRRRRIAARACTFRATGTRRCSIKDAGTCAPGGRSVGRHCSPHAAHPGHRAHRHRVHVHVREIARPR